MPQSLDGHGTGMIQPNVVLLHSVNCGDDRAGLSEPTLAFKGSVQNIADVNNRRSPKAQDSTTSTVAAYSPGRDTVMVFPKQSSLARPMEWSPEISYGSQ